MTLVYGNACSSVEPQCSTMDLLTWTLASAIFVSLYYYFKKQLNYFEDKGIPYTPGWPVLGNMASVLALRKNVSTMVQETYKISPGAKYVGAFDFMVPVVVVRDPELIKTIAIKNFDNFQDRRPIIDVSVDPLLGGNLFSMGGDRWREARALLSPAFTSSKMKGMYELMVECAKNVVKYLEDKTPSERRNVDTKDVFTKITNDIIATCAFGITVDSLKDPNNEFYVLGKQAAKFNGIALIKFFLFRAFPSVVKLFNISFLSDRVMKFFKNIVEQTVSMRKEKGVSRPDMIQLMIDARKENGKLEMDIAEMTAQVFIFFLGGFDTTSSQMCLIAHELAINPEIQKKLQDEVDNVLRESNGKPTYEQIMNMPLLDAVFKESLRLHTQFHFLERVCLSPFELPPALPGGKPFIMPKGTVIWIPSTAVHRDPQYHENPLQFDPDRYHNKKLSINDVNNLGFGIGPRSCIGNRFATLEIKVIFFHLLSKFNLKPNEKTCNPLTYSKNNFNLIPNGGFSVAVESRN